MSEWKQRRRQAKTDAKTLMRKGFRPFLAITLIVYGSSLFFTWLNNMFAPKIFIEQGITSDMITEQLAGFGSTGVTIIILINILYLLVSAPIALAAADFFFKAAGTNEATLKGLSKWTMPGLVIKAILLSIWVGILALLWTLLLYGVPLGIGGILYAATWNPAAIILLAIVAVIGLIYVIVRTSIYNAAWFLISENPELGVREAVRASVLLMRKHMWEYFVFNLSFILWALLTLITIGIASIYTYPYVQTATAYFIRDIMRRDEEQKITNPGEIYD